MRHLIRRTSIPCLLVAAFLSSCSDSSTNPDDSCNITDLTLIGPETIEVGLTVQLDVDIVQGAGGDCPSNRLVGNWTSSNPDVVEILINPFTGQVGLRADLTGTAEITVSLMGMTSSITVEVVPPAVPSGIAYGLVDQTGAADNTYAFNNLGAPLTAIHTATGRYRVTVPGFMGGPDETRVAFANAVNDQNAVCVATEWTLIGGVAGGNATVDVACSTVTGTAVDSDFVIFLIGQHGLPGYYAIAHSGVVAGLPDTFLRGLSPNSAWSRVGGVSLGRTDSSLSGRFFIRATGLPPTPETGYAVILSPAGSADSRCTLVSFGFSSEVSCRPPGGNGYAPAPFSWMVFGEGRAGMRIGTAWANNPTSPSYPPHAIARRNSSGGDIAITRSDVGTYEVHFAGLGRTDQSRREIVMVSTLERDGGEHCKVAEPWSTGVSTDLTVQVRCVNGTGDPSDVAFFIVVLE